MTYSTTFSETFTRTHAKELAAKVITDLYQCSVLYDHPGVGSIADYQTELVEMLVRSYVASYEFGFKRNGKRVLTWRYTVGPDGGLHATADAGGLYAKAAVANARYYNFMDYTDKWCALTGAQRTAFKNSLPFQRISGSLPDDGDGYWETNHGYTAGGVRVERSTFRPW